MWMFRKEKHALPQTLKNVEDIVAEKNRKASFFIQGQAALFFMSALVFLISCALVMITNFYNTHIEYSRSSWLRVSNLTPVKDVIAPASGVLNKVFVSVGQRVQKGAILASVRMDDIQLDYDDTKKDFAEKIVELHCLGSGPINCLEV